MQRGANAVKAPETLKKKSEKDRILPQERERERENEREREICIKGGANRSVWQQSIKNNFIMKYFVALFALLSIVNAQGMGGMMKPPMGPNGMMPSPMMMMNGIMKMLPKKTHFYMTTPEDDCGSPPSSFEEGNPKKEACKIVSLSVSHDLRSYYRQILPLFWQENP
jgi:hypothetical protein